jgi:hypothetical protein
MPQTPTPRIRSRRHLTIDGFAFDVELLYLARLAGFRIREVGIIATAARTAASASRAGIASVLDVLRVRLKGGRSAAGSSGGLHVLRTRPFRTLTDIEGYALALAQVIESCPLARRLMEEIFDSIRSGDEPESFVSEAFDRSGRVRHSASFSLRTLRGAAAYNSYAVSHFVRVNRKD